MPPRLIPLTEDAKRALSGEQKVIERFPFRVGRERRALHISMPESAERRTPKNEPTNDLYILDVCELFKIPDRHIRIERQGGEFFLSDLGSPCGTIVEGKTLGGNHEGGRASLRDHDVIILGSALSPLVFKFRTE